MMADKALVRRLSACETMGSATTICSDKTGTLTLNQMTVVEAHAGGVKLSSPDSTEQLASSICSLMIEGIAQNTTANVFVPEEGSEVHVHWKGAAEIVLASCTNWMDSNGQLQEMTPNQDPCRPGVRDAVELCTKAGVKVRMVTGDNLQTAKAIALECGILHSEEEAIEPTLIEGKVFRAYSEKAREEVAEKISVMGRSSPNDKLLLVQALRKKGHVVAVTGDGTNDAPALNEVVRWGRSVYANIQKFIQFQLTVNVAALVINVVAAFSSGEIPLNAVELLWVNLIMDTLGALALATEPPTNHLMERHPVGRREPLITNIMWRNIIVQAFYQVTVLFVLNFDGRNLLHLNNDMREHADKVKNTFIFNTFVFCQIFNEFNARKPDEMNVFKGVTKNHLFMGIVGMTIVLQVVIIEFLGKFTKTVRLNWNLWLISIAIALLSWPIAVAGKPGPVPTPPFRSISLAISGNRVKNAKAKKLAQQLICLRHDLASWFDGF
ncbi:hypothetical protein HPP92_020203 [Vanilla planifolia]|uniref:P-type Ca(2+) transporter n=1 Tax=Vanilla planifolia TaxID=51239 RepID=A0A835Q5I1_VANPL|nr:hypothetical protein HPP92_020203 [Vanilla planifolia]